MLAALAQNFPTAVRTFEEMARQSLSQTLAKWSIKEHLFKASLCMLASKDYDVRVNLPIPYSSFRQLNALLHQIICH